MFAPMNEETPLAFTLVGHLFNKGDFLDPLGLSVLIT